GEGQSGGGEAVNTIVAVDLVRPGREPGHVLIEGHEFFCAPRLSPDGRAMIWLAWDHPNMPWNGTTLYLADVDEKGHLGEPRIVAGGPAESIFHPEWSPDGRALVFVSDRSNWWNHYPYNVPA